MLVLSGRLHDKIVFPGFHTSVEVVSIQAGTVRLGIEAPEEVRVLRQGIPDREAEWGPAPEAAAQAPTLVQLNQLVDRRLAVAHRGLTELYRHLRSGRLEEAETILDKLHEDLHLLQRRVRREVEKAAPPVPASREATGRALAAALEPV
jgi:carbon storage regulator CsrA